MEALANNPTLLNALQSKINTLVGKSSGYIESLPQPIQDKIANLSKFQEESLALEMEFRSQVLELVKKFAKLHLPIYQKRFDVITGKDDDDGEKGIPSFWLTAMSTHPLISEIIHDGDDDALKHLIDIRVEYLADNPGFKLDFVFEENPYFTNKILEKTYFLDNNPHDPFGDLIYQKAIGIDWKQDHDLTCKVEMKKQRKKGTKETRMVQKTVPRETFFNFFSPIQLPDQEDGDDDLPDDFEERIEMDYEIGELIKEKIIPRAIDWFTGKALQDEQGDEDWDDEYDEDNADQEDDDQEEQGEGQKAKGENPPECKQQ